MEIQDILTLIQAVDEHGLTQLKLDNGEIKLSLKKEEAIPPVFNVAGPGYPAGMTAAPDLSNAALVPPAAVSGREPAALMQGAAGMTGAAQAPGIASDQVVTSPLVGTFYNASSPEAEPFVKVGDAVKKGQVLGIIEAMKLMNEIECEYDGVVEAILVDNEGVVEYGQPLFRIR